MSTKPIIKVVQGATLRRVLRTPWDLTGYSISAQLRDENGSGQLRGSFSCTLQTNPKTGLQGQIQLVLGAATTELLEPGKSDYAFDVKLAAPNGDITYTPRIWVNVSDRVTG